MTKGETMNNKVIGILAFVAGGATGVLASMQYFKKKYERIAQEEIEAAKEYYLGKNVVATETEDKETSEYESTKEDVADCVTMIHELGYMQDECDAPNFGITVIPPEEYGESMDYEQISLNYYSDGILADDDHQIIDNPADYVGEDFASHFGEYEDDSVFVRNERLKCEYEILLNQRNYADVIKQKPYLMESYDDERETE